MTSKKSEQSKAPEIALAYVGSIVPDEPEYHNPAFSRAGVMFQQNLLEGLKRAGLVPSQIFSVRPIQSFPGGNRLWVKKERAHLGQGMFVTLLPFLNLTPLKQFVIGVATLWALLVWGWRTRGIAHRVVYTFNLTVPPGLSTLLGARLIGAKAVVSLNDIHEPGHMVPATLFHRFDFWMQRQLIPLFDGHIAVADKIMADFAPGKPYLRLEGGIANDVLEGTGKSLRLIGDQSLPFTIVSAGRLDETNGVRVLLESFSILEGDHYRLRIAGTGPLEAEVRQAAAKDSRIEFCGFISFEKVLALYDSADVLINMRLTKDRNTRYFFPSKLMEYLASGTPVITTCTGHVEEEFGDFVFLLENETSKGLSEAIRQVASIAHESRADMGRRAREYMVKNKSWDSQGRKVLKFILENVI